MIYAQDASAVERRRRVFLGKWRVAMSLEEAGGKLFTFARLPVEQWKSVRTTNAVERLHLIVQTPDHDSVHAAFSRHRRHMLFWALLASELIVLRKVGGWESLAELFAEPIDLAV